MRRIDETPMISYTCMATKFVVVPPVRLLSRTCYLKTMATKRCTICKETKPLSEFNKNSRRRDGLQSACRECNRKRARAYYERNRDAHKQRCAELKRARRDENHQRMVSLLREQACIDCGSRDPLVLEFDHRENKRWNISRMYTHSWATIVKELAKCDVRCANCHRRKTHQETNTFRWQAFRALVGRVGVEPTTARLKAECSTS